jgi:1-acyl-sn-glycerol-3-phosphate acyltransferase
VSQPGVKRETLTSRWLRRAVTLPAYFALCAASLCLLPLTVAAAAVVDLVRGGPWVRVRCVLFFTFYLCCEVAGVVMALGAWLLSAILLGRGGDRFRRWNFQLECWWTSTLLAGAQRVFAMRVEAENAEVADHGPFLLFIRHASVGDTLLPAVLVSKRYDIELRYVLKHELLWDPCLDIVGNRLLNYFARRGSGDSEREVRAVQRLAEDLGPCQGVLIYPEGTRFTAVKRQRILERLAQSRSELLEPTQALSRVLPPRLGGPLGLIECSPNADVVFCVHTGFEGAGTFNDLMKGTLVGAVIRVSFWRVPCAEIPRDRAAQVQWLFAQWRRVDDWVAANGKQ